MPNAIFFNTYKLKKGKLVPDFLLATEKLVSEYASKQKGFISFNLLVDGETWADFGIFETMEDAKNFENPSGTNELAEKFYSFLNFNSCRSRIFSIEKSYEHQSAVPSAVTFISFKLKKGASAPDFLIASEKLHGEFMSKQKGYISWKQLIDGEMWADLLTWETMDDAQNAIEASGTNAAVHAFGDFIDEKSVKMHFYSVEKNY